MPTIDLNGVKIHYRERGEQNSNVLVLLHGFPLDSRMWNAPMEALSNRWRMIAPDFRGFGESGGTGPFTIEQLADDVHALVERLRPGKIVLAGLSMGGYVALAHVRKYQATLRGLILLDTKAEADTPEGKAGRDKMIAMVKEKGNKPIADAMLTKLIPEEAVKNRPQLVRELRQMMESTRPETIAHALAAMRDRPDQTEVLGRIVVPTLLIVGEKDGITPPDVMGTMQKKIPRSQMKVITSSGHMSPMEQPGQVNAAMEQFLAMLNAER
jgi:3-oxoadipate enol-lactonase